MNDKTDLGFMKLNTQYLKELGKDEKWLQAAIEQDPSVLGLGELRVLQRERPVISGGFMDFLLYDPEDEIRFIVEIQLGQLDESHIIRTIEYWDLERKRYPRFEHRAVIIAEEITGRFFNVIGLLNNTIPLIAMQLNAIQLGTGAIGLSCAKLIDINENAEVEETLNERAAEKVDRATWLSWSSVGAMDLVDQLLAAMKEAGLPLAKVTYNNSHIAVGSTGYNYMWFGPRKSGHLFINLKLPMNKDNQELIERYRADGFIFHRIKGDFIEFRMDKSAFDVKGHIIVGLVKAADAASKK